MAKKKHDPQAKAKRQKMIAAVGGVILLGLLAFQLPRTLKLLHPSNATASASASPPRRRRRRGRDACSPAADATSTGTAAATSADGMTDPGSAVPARSRASCSPSAASAPRIRSRSSSTSTASTGSDGCGTAAGSDRARAAQRPGGADPATAARARRPAGSGNPPPVKPTTAMISVNGTSETVSVGAQFPASSPVFLLVSLTKTPPRSASPAARSGQGGRRVTLKKRRPLTLMNTADGTRYVLRLVSRQLARREPHDWSNVERRLRRANGRAR